MKFNPNILFIEPEDLYMGYDLDELYEDFVGADEIQSHYDKLDDVVRVRTANLKASRESL